MLAGNDDAASKCTTTACRLHPVQCGCWQAPECPSAEASSCHHNARCWIWEAAAAAPAGSVNRARALATWQAQGDVLCAPGGCGRPSAPARRRARRRIAGARPAWPRNATAPPPAAPPPPHSAGLRASQHLYPPRWRSSSRRACSEHLLPALGFREAAQRRLTVKITDTQFASHAQRCQAMNMHPASLVAPAEHSSGTASSASPMVAACAATTLAAWMCSVRETCWCPPAGTASGASALAACTSRPLPEHHLPCQLCVAAQALSLGPNDAPGRRSIKPRRPPKSDPLRQSELSMHSGWHGAG